MMDKEIEALDSLFGRIDQVGIVVRSVDECVEYYEKLFGEGTFFVVEGEEPARLGDGREITIKGKLGLGQLGQVQIELIEILDGPSIHVDFLGKNGEGIHHIAVHTSEFERDIERYKERGIDVLQQGLGTIRYAYMDTKPVILELIEVG